MTQHNYLIIGLGGTGCAVVRELKKRLYIEWRSRGNSGPYPEIYTFQDDFGGGGEHVESRIATLSIDSNQEELEGQGEKNRGWRVFGETLRLGDREKVLLDPTGIDRILSSIERYPGIEPWIRHELDFVTDITRGTTEPMGCNQIRRMGRLALSNGNSIANVVGAVANRLQALSRGGQVGAEIHLACTLAAGTGSGSLIDVIAQIQRHLRSQAGTFELYVHGFATAKDVGDINTGNFYANQYAALLELNAFRLALYAPWDIAPTVGAGARRLIVTRPGESTGDLSGTFKSVALLTETTEGGRDVPLAQQIENAAEFIFQLAVRQMGDVPKPLQDALTMQDRAQFPADANGGTRSTAFIGYGVQRVAIPEREIREKLSYSFARQFVLKLLYHNWDNRYRENPRTFSRDAFVDARRGLWRVTHEHLCLDVVEEIAGQRAFETYETDWREELKRQADRVRQQLGEDFAGRKEWIADFDRRAERYWMGGFRSHGEGGGVSNYFKVRREPVEIGQRARDICGIIEKDLLMNVERMNNDYALHYLPSAIEFLVARIEEERIGFGKQAPEAVKHMEETDRLREEMRQQYVKGGRWAKGKHERIFQNYREASTRYYYWRTLQLAAEYAQEFCAVLIDDLKLLQQQVSLFDTRMKLVAKNFEEEMNARIQENGPNDEAEDTIYLVDARSVNNTIRNRFECDKSIQDSKATVTMTALSQLRSDRMEFAAYIERMPVDNFDRVGGGFVDELRKVAESNAVEAHRKIREDDRNFEGIFGHNIVRKLYTDYGGRVDGELHAWLRELIDKAMPMVSFDANEESMDLPTQGPVLRRCVFVPTCKVLPPEFTQQLRERVESITGARGGCRVVDTYYQEVPEDRNPSEIAIISVAFFFSPRFTRAAHELKAKYLERITHKNVRESRRAYFEVHTETHDTPLPDLLKLDTREVRKQHLAPVLLATALDLMVIPEQNGQQILFGVVDTFGRVQEKVESGMVMTAEIREAAAESASRFGHSIPVAMIALYSLYVDRFREASLAAVAKLVENKIREDRGVDLQKGVQRLNDMSGQCFLLSGKREDNETYKFFDLKTKEAADLARRLADRSAL